MASEVAVYFNTCKRLSTFMLKNYHFGQDRFIQGLLLRSYSFSKLCAALVLNDEHYIRDHIIT